MGGWRRGIETATFHILTPYPGTPLYARMAAAGRIMTQDWNRYDTRHAVFQPARMTPARGGRLLARLPGFLPLAAIFRSAWAQRGLTERLRHLAYAGGWKKCEPLWDWVIRAKRVTGFLPLLETVLTGEMRPTQRSAPAREPTPPGKSSC